MPDNVLHTWKEISQYVGCGVRTVQRWELMFALPVHRPSGRLRSSVFAYREEIDAWFHDRSTRFELRSTSPGAPGNGSGKPANGDGNGNGSASHSTNGNGKHFLCPTCGGSGHLVPQKDSNGDQRHSTNSEPFHSS